MDRLALLAIFSKAMDRLALLAIFSKAIETNQYKEETDIYLQFVNEERIKCNASCILIGECYDRFIEWLRKNGIKNVPIRKIFSDNIKKHIEYGAIRVKDRTPTHGFKNIKLKQEE
jgi:phage/plasmid-associated DNA primase